MPILGQVNPATILPTVLYTAPAGRAPMANINACSVSDQDVAFTIGLIKAGDRAVSAVSVVDGGKYTAKPNVTVTGANTSPAAASVAAMRVSDAAISAAGTGYAVGNTLTVATGTGTSATIRVDAVGANGVITAASVVSPGSYSVLPTQAANAVTGGAGTNAKFDLFFSITSVTVTAGGNGYDPAKTTVTADATGQVTAASLSAQFTAVFEPLTDSYHPTAKLTARGAVERSGLSLGAGDTIVVQTSAPLSINFFALGYEDLA